MSNALMIVPPLNGSSSNKANGRSKRTRRVRQARKPNRGPRRGRKNRRQRVRSNTSESCEKVFLKAALNPFDSSIIGKVCAPVFPARQSQKARTTMYLPEVTIGTANIGHVFFDVTPVSGSTCAYYTTALYTGTAATNFATSGTGIATAAMQGPYLYPAFDATDPLTQVSGRAIVAGIRWRYTGTTLNKGGKVFTIISSNQNSLVGSPIGGASFAQSKKYPVTNDWQSFTIMPQHTDDWTWIQAQGATTIFPWTDSAAPQPFIAVVFSGTVGNTFEVEIVVHCEYSGGPATMAASPTDVGDPQIINAIHTAATSAQTNPDSTKSTASQILDTLGAHPGILKGAGALLTAGLSALYTRPTLSDRFMRMGFDHRDAL